MYLMFVVQSLLSTCICRCSIPYIYTHIYLYTYIAANPTWLEILLGMQSQSVDLKQAGWFLNVFKRQQGGAPFCKITEQFFEKWYICQRLRCSMWKKWTKLCSCYMLWYVFACMYPVLVLAEIQHWCPPILGNFGNLLLPQGIGRSTRPEERCNKGHWWLIFPCKHRPFSLGCQHRFLW